MVKKEKMKVKLPRKDIAYKYFTKKYRKGKQIRCWDNVKAAAADVMNLRRRGYKVKLSKDKKSAVIIGKTTRGYEKTSTGKRAIKSGGKRRSTIQKKMKMKKPYTPTGHQTFRQPSYTLRKFGWSN